MQFSDKGAKAPEITVRHDLDEWITADVERAGLARAQGVPIVSGRPATLQPADRMGALASRRGEDAQVPGRGPEHNPLKGVRFSVVTDRRHCGFLRVSIDRRLVGRVSPACVRFASNGP